MGGMGDIGGGCWVTFSVDHSVSGDRRQRFSAFDAVAARRGRKSVTIAFPRGVAVRRVGANRVSLTVGRRQRIRIRWT